MRLRRYVATMSVALALCGAARPAAAGDLIDTVTTVRSRATLSTFLVKPAEAAASKRNFARAIALYSALVVARGPGSDEARKLATLWTLAGQTEDAARVLQAFAAATADATAASTAKTEVTRLLANPDPFAKTISPSVLAPEAKQAFKQGRAAFAKKNYGDALVSYQMGYALAPDLPGFLRELGATYDKLGATDKKIEFYRAYLLRRPFGKNSDAIRTELGAQADSLGALSLSSSLPCDEIWLNRQRVTGPPPTKPLVVAPGNYKALCLSRRYEIAIFEYATVTAATPASIRFDWAIIENQLTSPLGRIAIENPKSPGEMLDLGVSSSEVGVVVASNGRALRMVVKDDSGARSEDRAVRIRPGERYVVKW
jgi:Flp pilus assembly protein TadD